MERLESVLKTLPHLDLSGQIDNIQPIPKDGGVSCDVFVGEWRSRDGQIRRSVAIKRLRFFLQVGDIPKASRRVL